MLGNERTQTTHNVQTIFSASIQITMEEHAAKRPRPVVLVTVAFTVKQIRTFKGSEFEAAQFSNATHRHLVFNMHFDKLAARFFSALKRLATSATGASVKYRVVSRILTDVTVRTIIFLIDVINTNATDVNERYHGAAVIGGNSQRAVLVQPPCDFDAMLYVPISDLHSDDFAVHTGNSASGKTISNDASTANECVSRRAEHGHQ